MKDNVKQVLQVALIVLGPLLIKHHISIGNDTMDEIAGVLSDAIGIYWKLHHWNTTPSAPIPPTSSTTP